MRTCLERGSARFTDRTAACAAASLAVALMCGVAACGGHEPKPQDAAPASASATASPPVYRRQAGGYRVVGSPMIFIGEPRGRPPSIELIVRFNRPLRRDPNDGEGFGADFRIDNAGSLDAAPGRIGRASRHCYFGSYGNDTGSLKDPQDGQRVVLKIDIRGVKRQLRVPAVLRGTLPPAEQRSMNEALCGAV